MSVEIKLPQLGFSMEEGQLVEWHVTDGDLVGEGQLLYSLEAEKAVQEIESPVAGQIRSLVQAGETYPVGAILAIIDPPNG